MCDEDRLDSASYPGSTLAQLSHTTVHVGNRIDLRVTLIRDQTLSNWLSFLVILVLHPCIGIAHPSVSIWASILSHFRMGFRKCLTDLFRAHDPNVLRMPSSEVILSGAARDALAFNSGRASQVS